MLLLSELATQVYSVLLFTHIVAGIAAVLSLFVAVYSKLVQNRHSLHLISGRIFTIGMSLVFITTVPLTIIKPNLFLLAIGIFSFYMTFHGWRVAVNRKGIAGFWDKRGAEIMLLTSLVMGTVGGYQLFEQEDSGLMLLVFGSIGGYLALQNLLDFRAGRLRGKERISSHIGSMMGAGIAAITAALVTNVQTDPVWMAWMAPTLVITPFIFLAIRRHRRGQLPKPVRPA